MTTSNEHNNAPAVPQDMRIVPIWLLERVEQSLGAFTSDEGWAQTDMDTMDSVSAMIAATTAPAPAQDAKVMPQLHRAVAKAQQIQPVLVLVVEKEPDYWSGGHFHEGTKSCIDPTKVWALPIGTKLYADSNHTPPVPCIGESYVG